MLCGCLVTSLTFWRRPCFLAYRVVMGCAFLWGQAAAVPVLQCLGNGEPLAEGGAVLTPCNSRLLGSVQAQGHDCRGPSSLLPPSSSGCSVRGAPHLMREDSAHLSLRPRVLSHVCIAYRLLLVREGRFSLLLPVPQAPPLPGGCHKPRCHASPQTRRARRGTHKTCPHVFTASFT